MKLLKMKVILYCCVLAIGLSSCFTMVHTTTVSRVELGMPKTQVIKIMGNTFKLGGVKMVGNDKIEVVEYYDDFHDEVYQFHFSNDKLTEWNKIRLKKHDCDCEKHEAKKTD